MKLKTLLLALNLMGKCQVQAQVQAQVQVQVHSFTQIRSQK
jgi:hypothetical protein